MALPLESSLPALLASSEPVATAIFLAVVGAMLAASVLLARTIERLGVPVVLLFLAMGMLGGSEGIGGIYFDDYQFAVRVGTAALVLILFDGGLNTSVQSVRAVLWPASLLATLGVALTAALVAGFARLLGLGWPEALLLGAVVSSTDAAAVFAVLRGGRLSLKPRVGQTIEVESCINDPMAVILTLAIMQWIAEGAGIGWSLAWSVPYQLVVGAGVGLLLGYLGRWLLRSSRLTTVGLYPVLTLAIAFCSFGLATLAQSSGFMSVYVTALVLGAGPLPYRSGLTRIHDALGWLSQISMFLMLGLLVFPSQLPAVAGIGIGVALFLGLVARPLAVVACLLPFRYPLSQTAYIAWVGLRGAVPIILASFPVLAHVRGAEQVFNIVFFVVVISSLVPGATIRLVTRWLKVDQPERPRPSAMLEVNAAHLTNGQITPFYVDETLAVAGAKLSEIVFPSGASVVLIVRGRELVPARGSTVLIPGDHAYVFYREEDRPLIELLFGGPQE